MHMNLHVCSKVIINMAEIAYTGINTGLLSAVSSGGGNQICSSILVLFSMYTFEIQPQKWKSLYICTKFT